MNEHITELIEELTGYGSIPDGQDVVAPSVITAMREKRRNGLDWPGLHAGPDALTMIGVKRMQNIADSMESVITRMIPGDVAECGVWRGGAAMLMRELLAHYGSVNHNVWCFDSFEGIPADSARTQAIDKGVDFAPADYIAVSLEQVRENFRKHNALDGRVKFVKGWFKDTLIDSGVGALALLRLDGDMYESTMDCLTALYDRVSPGGIVIIDDYNLPTCRAAVTDFRAQRGIEAPLVDIDGSGAWWQKGAEERHYVPLGVGSSYPCRSDLSVCHTSARPDQWESIYADWCANANNPHRFEYVLVVDKRWGFTELPAMNPLRPQDRALWNTGRRCYVDGVNIAARHSVGDLLIVNADDQYSCDGWDSALISHGDKRSVGRDADFVVEVSTGTPNEHERGVMVMPILSRARYKKLGYALFPDYESMYADNDFAAHAIHDGCVINARDLMFPHKHPLVTGGDWDAAYKEQNRTEAYAIGRDLFERRKAGGFTADNTTQLAASVDPRPIIAVCLPGDMVSMHWMVSWMNLFSHLTQRYRVVVSTAYASSASVTRSTLIKMLKDSGQPISFVLWLDDDNTLTPEQFEMLYADLEQHPELDVVVGWTWIAANDEPSVAIISCGRYDGASLDEGKHSPLTLEQLSEGAEDLKPIDASGFPVVLMRYQTIEKAGVHPFAHIVDDRFEPWGMSGEDHAFFIKAAQRGGCKFAVDRRVHVPHFKRRAAQPTNLVMPPQQVQVPSLTEVLVN